MGSRVGEIRIQARVAAALVTAEADLRQQLEGQLVVGVLEEVERQVHARLGPDVIVRARHLSLAWRLGLDDLAVPAVLARLAGELVQDLVTALDAQPAAERLRPRDPAVVRFVDEPHALAAALADAADGVPRQWFHPEPARPDSAWDEAVAAGPAAVAAVVAWLERMERLAPALALASEPALAAVAALDPARREWVALIRARRQAGRLTGGATAGLDPAGADGATAPGRRAAELRPPTASTDAPGPAPTPLARPGAAGTGDGSPPPAIADGATGAAVEPTSRPPAPAQAAASAEPVVDAAIDEPAATGPRATTRHAGVLFLAARVLELDLAEALWAAGVDEGAVLTAIAQAIVDDPDDPACAWLGGAVERAPVAPTIAAWATDEISAATQHALGRRLVRFGVTHTPAGLAEALAGLATTWPVAPTLEPGSAQIVRHGAAALAMIVAARLGRPPSRALLQAVCARPGELVWTAAALHVLMPAGAIDLSLRRAGLDQDAGYVPWLRRKVLFEYVGLEVETW
ncbi:MAG: hypothetical protein R3B06_04735 [Kofleriaceae bacterium]